jgi:hypothetical protein
MKIRSVHARVNAPLPDKLERLGGYLNALFDSAGEAADDG